jgi:hypothetical protein
MMTINDRKICIQFCRWCGADWNLVEKTTAVDPLKTTHVTNPIVFSVGLDYFFDTFPETKQKTFFREALSSF